MKKKMLKKALTFTLSATLAFSSVAAYAVDFTEPDVITEEDTYADFSYNGFGDEETVYDEPEYYGEEGVEEVFVSDYESEEENASEQYNYGTVEENITEEETSEESIVSDETYESSDETIVEDLESTEQLASDNTYYDGALWTVVNNAVEFDAAYASDAAEIYIKLGENFDGSALNAEYYGELYYRNIYIDFNGNPTSVFAPARIKLNLGDTIFTNEHLPMSSGFPYILWNTNEDSMKYFIAEEAINDLAIDNLAFGYKYLNKVCAARVTTYYKENGEEWTSTKGCRDLQEALSFGFPDTNNTIIISLNKDITTIADVDYQAEESSARLLTSIISPSEGYQNDVIIESAGFSISNNLNWWLVLNPHITLTTDQPLFTSDGNSAVVLSASHNPPQYVSPSNIGDGRYFYKRGLTPDAEGWYEVSTYQQFAEVYRKDESPIKIRLIDDITLEENVDYEGSVNNREIYLDTNSHSISFLYDIRLRKGDLLYTKDRLNSWDGGEYYKGIIAISNINDFTTVTTDDKGDTSTEIDWNGLNDEQKGLYVYEYVSDEDGFSYMYAVEPGAATYEYEQEVYDNPGEYIVNTYPRKILLDAIEIAFQSARTVDSLDINLIRDIDSAYLLWGNRYGEEIPLYGMRLIERIEFIKEHGYPYDEITLNINCGEYTIDPGMDWCLGIGEGVIIVTDKPVDWIASAENGRQIEPDTTTEPGRYVYKVTNGSAVNDGWIQVSTSEQFINAYNSSASPVFIELTDSFTLHDSVGWDTISPKTVYLALGDNSITFEEEREDGSIIGNWINLGRNDIIYSDKPIRDAENVRIMPIHAKHESPDQFCYVREDTVNTTVNSKSMLCKYTVNECAATTTRERENHPGDIQTITFGCASLSQALNAGEVINNDFVDVNVLRDLTSFRDFIGDEPPANYAQVSRYSTVIRKPSSYEKEQFTVNLNLNGHTVSLEDNKEWGLSLVPGITLVSDEEIPFVDTHVEGSSVSHAIVPDTTSIPGKFVYVATNEPAEEVKLTINAGNGTYNGKKNSTINCYTGQKYSDILDPEKIKSSNANKEFAYWSTDQSGNEEIDPDEFIKGAVTLYAQYKDIIYTIILDANGGYFAVPEEKTFTSTAPKGKALTIFPSDDPTNFEENQKFVGWAQDPEGKNKISNLRTYKPTMDGVVYAVYEKQEILKITLDANGGYFATPEETTFSTTATKGQKMNFFPSDDPTNPDENKRFVAWAKDREGNNRISNLRTYIPKEDETIYAVYEEPESLDVQAEGYSGEYDGTAHSITVTAKSGSTITYAKEGSDTYSKTKPTFKDAGLYTVHFKVTKSGALDVTGSRTVEIQKRGVTVSGIKAQDKNYDGTTEATLDCSKAVFDGILKSDKLVVMGTGAFEDEAVGENKTVWISELTLGGTSEKNYKLIGQQTETSANILPNPLKVTATGYSGNYDGKPHQITVVTDEDANIYYGDSAEDIYQDANPSFTDAGEHIVYYRVEKTGSNEVIGSQTVEIKKKDVTISGIKAEDKYYDGNTEATLNTNDAVIKGLVEGDDLHFTAVGTFANATAGNNKKVTISGLTLEGDSNYQLAKSGQQKDTKATILKKGVTVSGITAKDKSYDGKTTATLDFSHVEIEGILPGDVLTVTGTGTFENKEIGENKKVTITGLTLGGKSAGNYQLAAEGQQTETKASIEELSMAVTVKGFTGKYDGKAHTISVTAKEKGAEITYAKTEGGEYSTTNPSYKDAGEYKVFYRVKKDGYKTVEGQATVKISQKEVKVSGIKALDKPYDKGTDATLDYSKVKYNGIVKGDSLTVTATGAFADAEVGKNKTVTISNLNLGGDAAQNYILSEAGQQTTAKASITPEEYKIIYDLGDDSVTNPNPTGYTAESANITLKNPTRSGFKFVGWTWADQDVPTKTVVITKESTGEKWFKAHWKEVSFYITPDGNTVFEDSCTLFVGDKETFSLEDIGLADCTAAKVTSDNKSVATVSIKGQVITVTAKKAGETAVKINPTRANGQSAICKVTVVPKPALKIKETKKTVYTSEEWSPLDIWAEDGDLTNVTFESGKPGVAGVNGTDKEDDHVIAHVKGITPGSAVIVVHGEIEAEGVTFTQSLKCTVTVKKPTLTLSPTKATLSAGKSTTVTVKVTPAGAEFEVTDYEEIAEMTREGNTIKFKGTKAGTATVTVSVGDVKKTLKLTVK